MQPTPNPPRVIGNHMAWAIVSLVLFWPLAIPAIVNAAKVNPLLAAGDHDGAQQAEQAARKWSMLATVVGIIWWILLVCCPLGILVAAEPTQVGAWAHNLFGDS